MRHPDKEYPQLYATLCKQFNRRKAVKLIRQIKQDDDTLLDDSDVACTFAWYLSRHGHPFWDSVARGQI